jgi:predicted signal transduction protein with EAL and GGDEF domain
MKKSCLSPNLQLYFVFSLFKKKPNYREFKLMVSSTVTVVQKHLHTLPNTDGLIVRVSILVTLAFL